MRLPLIAQRTGYFSMEAGAAKLCTNTPPRDRTSRGAKAVQICQHEWQQAYDLAQEKGLNAARSLRFATVAYKLAMPVMDSLPSIRAAIACIAHGITLEVFDGRDGSQLLYAAQVALSVLHRKVK
jgi:hypothetical protein